MPVQKNTTYPARATNKAWQKQKSFIDKAKAKSKTGLGAKLTAAELAWGKIKWNALDTTKFKPLTVQKAQEIRDAAAEAFKAVEAARSALLSAHGMAALAGTNSALSKPARTAANSIADDLDDAQNRLNGLELQEFDALVNRLREQVENSFLKDVTVTIGGTVVAELATASMPNSNTLDSSSVAWKLDGGQHHLLVDKKAKLKGSYKDGSPFAAEMTLTEVRGRGASFRS